MTRGYMGGGDGITRDMDLEERAAGYRGVQHNPFDPACRVRYYRDNHPANRCPICREEPDHD